MGHGSALLMEVLILLATAVVVVPLFQRLGLGAVLAYLTAGAAIGPAGLGWIGDVPAMRELAEFGVVFLLFLIGLELKPARLWTMRAGVFGLGGAQVILTAVVLTLIVRLLGLEWRPALVIGAGLALSSTAIGVRLMVDRKELGSPSGRASFGVLLFQDLAVAPLLALVPALATQGLAAAETDGDALLADIGLAVVEGLGAILVVILVGRFLLRPLLHFVALGRSGEVFTAVALLLVLGAALLAAANRKLNWAVIRDASYSTMKTTAMVMMLFIGGKFFSTVFMSMGGGDVVADLLIGSGLNRWMVLIIMMAIVFLMGMFIDWAAILLVTVPIFLPIAVEIGFDPLWFSILLCVNLQTSFLTPPFGYALFYFKGVAPEGFTMMHIYRGILPFVALQLISILVLCLFPALVTWLPGVFFG